MRQKAANELNFIAISELDSASEILIDASSAQPGDYTIILESYDYAGGVYSTLKTDTISLIVTSALPEILPL